MTTRNWTLSAPLYLAGSLPAPPSTTIDRGANRHDSRRWVVVRRGRDASAQPVPPRGGCALCGRPVTLGGSAVFSETCNGANAANVARCEQTEPRAIGVIE